MILVHATPKRNLASIIRGGLRPDMSRSRTKAVHLFSARMFGDAVNHCCARHKIEPDEVVIIGIEVPRSWLKKGKRSGLWNTKRHVAAARVRYTVAITVITIEEA